MKKLILFSLCIVFTCGILTGCSKASAKKQPAASRDNSIKTTEESAKASSDDTEQKETDIEGILPVYGMDSEVMNKEINFYIRVPENLTLEKKLDIIADKLSRFKFSGLPIKVINIKNENGKKIAVVDLEESSINKGITDPEKITGNPGATWRFGYFQGSAGGSASTETLAETFLQRKYKGQWIDGVTFLYENKPIDMFEHVPDLAQTIYR